MKKLLFLIIIFNSFSSIHAQCEPEEGFPLDRVALYPLPFGIIPVEDGGTGITDTAFIGEMFDFTFTVIFPDTFLDPATNSLTIGDTLMIIPDSTRFVFNEEILEGFPEGLSLEVNPDPMLGTSDGAAGCIRLFGTPSTNLAPGDYTMNFGANSCVQNPAFTGCIYVEIPSIFIGIVGEYVLTIADRTSASLDLLNAEQDFLLSPNPFNETANINFKTNGLSGDYQLQISDLSGQRIHSEIVRIKTSNQSISIETGDWINGIYLFRLTGREGQLSGRMVKQN